MLSYHLPPIGVIALLVMLGQGCAYTPPSSGGARGHGHPAVAAAERVVGAPYRYGGRTPRGFDCSGLVYYAYRQAGKSVPRTTRDQLRQARPVGLDELHAGDLLFFELGGKKVSHVGIYVGAGSFIHAPSTGKTVSYGSLVSAFWNSRLLGAGRFY